MPEHTIAENLARLQAARTAIGAAITAKGGTVDSGDGFEEFPADIDAIPSGGEPEPPADGKTRLYISLAEGRLSPVLGLGVNGTVDVDWGDGTVHGTLTGTSTSTLVTIPHTYAQGGDYVITLTVAEGTTMTVLGSSSGGSGSLLLTKNGTSGDGSRVYLSALKKAHLGDSVTRISNEAFTACYGLASIVIPDSVTSIGHYAFTACYGLASIVIPDSVTSIGESAFISCYGLASIVLPDSVTSIEPSTFYSCYGLTSIVIPDSVTIIKMYAFRNCYGLNFIRFESTTPPVVNASDTFSGLPTDCVIYVPQGKLDAYTSATNYPDDSVYTYVEY